jgi:hypothetical protein
VLLHASAVDLKAVMDELVTVFLPQETIKLLPVYIRPVQDLVPVIPQRAFTAKIAIVGDNFDWYLLPGTFFFTQICFHIAHREITPNAKTKPRYKNPG